LVATQGTLLFAQEAKEKKNELPKVEMLTLKVRVLDPDEHPVEGATVMPRGLRTKINRGSWWTWVEQRDGPAPKVLTDSDGIAEVPYPKYTYEKMEVGTVNLLVTHPDFVKFDDDRNVDDEPATVGLQRGFRIAATAIDAISGEKINTDLYAFVSVAASGEWDSFNLRKVSQRSSATELMSRPVIAVGCCSRTSNWRSGHESRASLMNRCRDQ